MTEADAVPVVDGTLTPVPVPRHPEQEARSSRITVAFDVPTGAVHGGATGMLYGLSDPGIPARQLVSGVRPRTVAQKSPGGAQHPTGDALEIVEEFVAAGGEEVLVYLQDDYAQWPYEYLGIDDYVARVTARVRLAMQSPHASAFAWVPFNEPDWIWYADWDADRDRFFEHWSAVHAAIRGEDPTGRIVGPNEMEYRPRRLRDFLGWAAAEGVLPDVMSWHELAPESLAGYEGRFEAYRELERELGIGPLPVNITEYGNRRDMSVPGQMIQWIAMFERTKVDADIAYWTMAGNLDDHAVQTTGANGGWWLLFWYARLGGHTVHVGAPFPGIPDTAQAVAAVDPERRSATVVLGGAAGDITVAFEGAEALASGLGIEPGDAVRIVVERVTWTGQEGFAPGPSVVTASDIAWTGSLPDVDIAGGDRMAAHRVTVSVADDRAPQHPEGAAWSVALEAEEAELSHAVVVVHDDDAQKYAASGGRDVAGLTHPESAVTFAVDVPHDGEYDLTVVYGTPGTGAGQALFVDGAQAAVLRYPATLSRDYRGTLGHRLALSAGAHEISFRSSGDDGQLVDCDVSLDRVDLARVVVEAPLHTGVRDAETSGGARFTRGGIELRAGSRARFWVTADESGYYEIALDGASDAGLIVRDRLVGLRAGRVTVHLDRGISEVTVLGTEGVALLRGLEVVRRRESDRATVLVAADAGHAVPRPPGIGPGPVVVTVTYANGAKQDAENYNTDVVTLFLDVGEAGGVSVRVPLRHSYSWSNLWSVGTVIDLRTSDRDIVVTAASGSSPVLESIAVSPLVAP